MSGPVEQPSAPVEGADTAAVKHPPNCRCIKPKPAPVTPQRAEETKARPASAELPPTQAVSIDIYAKGPSVPPEERTGPHTVTVPHRIVLDGQPVYLPADSQITVTAGTMEATAVTLTLFARRVRIGYDDELDGPVGQPAGQPAPAADA